MLSRIINCFGSIYTVLGNWGVKRSSGYYFPVVTFLCAITCTYIHFKGQGWGVAFSDVVEQPWAFIGHQFTHPTLGHLVGNMLFLLFVGPACEKYFGHIKFLVVYLTCGIFAALGFFAVYPNSMLVGASGAISGLLAIYPFTQRSFVSLLVSGCMIFFYFLLNFQESLLQFVGLVPRGVGTIGHVAGGVAGLVLFCFICRKNQ